MKYVEIGNPGEVPGRLLSAGERFSFACHPGVSCFNKCCRNLNLYLYPYDIIRLKKSLKISTDEIIERHTDLVLRENTAFPSVLLRMADNAEKTCPFLDDSGCRVYPDRPQTCRAFPVEQGLYFRERGRPEMLHYFRPPDFCMGRHESATWTASSWEADQNAAYYNQMTLEWADIQRFFHMADPFEGAGPYCEKGKMAFMAAYNIDGFRDFVLNSTFLKRYIIKPKLRLKIKTDDMALLKLGFSWIRLFVFGINTGDIAVKK